MTQIAVAVGALGNPLFLLHLLAILQCTAILAFAWRHAEYRAAKWFTIWLGVNCVWIGLHTLGLTLLDPVARLVVDSLELTAIPVSATCWILFTLIYSGRWESIRRRPTAVLATATGLLALVILTNPLHLRVHRVAEVTTQNGISVVEGHAGLGVWLTLLYVYVLYLTGIVVLLELLAQDKLFRDQAVALLIAVLVPLAVAASVMSGRVPIAVDVTPLSFGLSSTLLAYAVFRSELLRMMPASYRVGERTAMEMVDQGVVVQDPNGRVVLTNPAAEGILGVDAHGIVGTRIDDALRDSSLVARRGPSTPTVTPSEEAEATTLSDGGVASSEERDTQTLHDPRTGKTYEVHESTIEEEEEEEGPALGQTLFFRDVTDERRRKERLLVLNRIVRHNLRNDMNVLRGHVELIQETVDAESAAVVGEIASDLVTLGEKAHQMDRIIRESSVEDAPVNVAGIVERAVVRQRPGAVVPIEVGGAVQAWTDTSAPVVRAIVSNLVENAVERSDRATDAPVTVDVTAEGEEVTVAVGDDGPEIPAREVATLLEGEVSALQASSGIGLWTVRWCVDIAEADWEIDTGDETTISVTFPGEAELQTAATGAPRTSLRRRR